MNPSEKALLKSLVNSLGLSVITKRPSTVVDGVYYVDGITGGMLQCRIKCTDKLPFSGLTVGVPYTAGELLSDF